VSDLESRTEDGKVFQICGTETRKAGELKLGLWSGAGSNKVEEGCIDLVALRLWCCKWLASYGGDN